MELARLFSLGWRKENSLAGEASPKLEIARVDSSRPDLSPLHAGATSQAVPIGTAPDIKEGS
jgi:hypothetical protein